jgi:protein-disulfide isomerase
VATVDGEPITMAEVEEAAGSRLAAMEFQYRTQRQTLIDGTLRNLVRERLFEEEAKSRGMSVEEMLKVEAVQTEVTREEAMQFYEQNKARMGGRSAEQVLPQIQQFLAQQKQNQGVDRFASKLESESDVVYSLEPLRADIDTEKAPTKGPSSASITLVEFSDFECGYCGRMVATLKQIESNYGDQVQIVFKQFPLDMHPNAKKASEAALCAHEHGKFWEMHDLLFQEQSTLGVPALKEKASRLGIDRTAFDTCLDSNRYAEQVEKDMQDGAAVGVTGTPALFINGSPVPGGAVPYDVLAKAIDEELERRSAN